MAAKRINGLYTSFNILCKENVSMIDKVMRCMYATMNEGDAQVTHTGQVRCLIYSSEYSLYKILESYSIFIQITKFTYRSLIHIHKDIFLSFYLLIIRYIIVFPVNKLLSMTIDL